MKSLVRPLTSVIMAIAALAIPIRLAAQKPELNPYPISQDGPAARSAAMYPQPMTPGAISLGGASKGPTSSGIPSTRKPHAASRGPIPSSGRHPDLELTFRIYNYSHVPPRMLKKAEEEAATILNQSGVYTRWIDCPTRADEFDVYPDCQRPLTAEDVLMNILPAAMTVKSDSPGDTLGIAAIAADGECNRYASIFFERIQEISRTVDVSPELVLGPVIAHEAGHLLLGSNSHSAWGIMQAVWDGDNLQAMARSVVGFTNTQGRQLRRNVVERMRLHPCGVDSFHDAP